MTATTRAVLLRPAAVPGVAAVGIAAAIIGLVLASTRPTVENLVQGHLIGDAAIAIVASLVGALLLGRIPGQPVGVLFSAVGLADGIALLASGLQSAHPVDVVLLWAAEWTWRPGLGLLALLPLLVPAGATARGERFVLLAGVVAIGVWTLGGATSARLTPRPGFSVPNPFALPGGGLLETGGMLACGVVALLSVAALVRRTVVGGPLLRRQLAPLLASGALVLVTVAAAPSLGVGGVIVQDLAVLLVPVACLISVLRLRLYGIEIAIGRSVVWIVLTAVLVGGYVAVVELAGRVLRLQEVPSSVVATALVALAFAPLRTGLQLAVARWLYGDRGDPAGALQRTTRLLAAGVDPADALDHAVSALGRAIRCPGARVLRDGVILAGIRDGTAAIAMPLRVGDRQIGVLEVLSRSAGERFSRTDERLLAEVAPALAAGAAAIVAAEELRLARSAMALTREAERRRVREQLHDDVGPSLAAAGLQVRTARMRLDRADTAGAREAMDAVAATVHNAAIDLRAAVDALGPRALDELGMAQALIDLCRSVTSETLDVDVDIDPLHALPAAVEATIYRIAAESLANVVRHSGARRVRVRLRCEQDELILVIADDGTTTSLERPGGLGIASMRARAEDLGGTFRVSTDSGTIVTASVPLPSTAATDA